MLCLATTFSLAGPANMAPSSQPSGGSNNKLFRTPNDVHRLVTHVFPKPGLGTMPAAATTNPEKHDSQPATFISPVVCTLFPFNDLLPSWNIDVPIGAGFYVEIRVGREGGDFWTPFYYLGGWGKFTAPRHRTLKDSNGQINIDYFQSSNAFDRIQYRVTFFANDPNEPPTLRRFSLAYSNTLNDPRVAERFREVVDPGPKGKWVRRLPVPFRSQNWESDELRPLVCSPTSLAMVLEYWGAKVPTVDVCRTVYDPEYHLYGNWWRAIQGAWTYGVPGDLERFGHWNAVKRRIAEGRPIVASTRADKGDLRHAPNYASSEGHLLVIAGFDPDGSVLINDPAMRTPERGLCKYHPDDVEKIWFDHGGVGYVLSPPEKGPSAGR